MTVDEIRNAIQEAVAGRGCFVVDVKVSRDNEIVISMESEEGIVDLDDCVAISRVFEEKFDRNVLDYEVTVSSAGLDQPFKVLRQYQKALGSQVEVKLRGGKKFVAELLAVSPEGVELKYSALEAVEGKKKKERVEHIEKFKFEEINSVRYYLEF